MTGLEKRVSEFVSSIEIAKKRCMAGILRAIRSKRRVPYHQGLTGLILFVLLTPRPSLAQTIQRYEGILIDASGSIAKGRTTSDLFREYLFSTKKLLLTEPANSRVWVSTISTDSFGGVVHEILKGWTPDARGVFTDDLKSCSPSARFRVRGEILWVMGARTNRNAGRLMRFTMPRSR